MGEVAAASPWVLLYSYLLTFQYHPEKYERVRDNARKSLHLSEILNIDAANRLIHYMKTLNIENTDDIDEDNAGTDRIS